MNLMPSRFSASTRRFSSGGTWRRTYVQRGWCRRSLSPCRSLAVQSPNAAHSFAAASSAFSISDGTAKIESASTLVASTRPLRSTMSPRSAGASIRCICCFEAFAPRSAWLYPCRYTSRASMAAAHSPKITAATTIRRLSVARQVTPPGSPGVRGSVRVRTRWMRSITRSPSRHDRFGRGIGREYAFNHDRFVAGGRDQVQLLEGQRLDAPGRLERLDFEPQMPRRVFLGRALVLELFDPVAVALQLEVLPCREQQHQD